MRKTIMIMALAFVALAATAQKKYEFKAKLYQTAYEGRESGRGEVDVTLTFTDGGTLENDRYLAEGVDIEKLTVENKVNGDSFYCKGVGLDAEGDYFLYIATGGDEGTDWLHLTDEKFDMVYEFWGTFTEL